MARPNGDGATTTYQGGTRMRLFQALKAAPDGLTATAIKQATGMLERSGHLARVLGQELAQGRIRVIPSERQTSKGTFRPVTLYALTSKGLKDLAADKVDRSKAAGGFIGRPWSKARRQAKGPHSPRPRNRQSGAG